MQVSLRTYDESDVVIVDVVGEVDAHTVEPLRQTLADLVETNQVTVVTDLTGVTFMDSSGLGVLVNSLKQMRRRGGLLQLVVNDERLLKTFRITSLASVFTIHPTIDAAIAAIVR